MGLDEQVIHAPSQLGRAAEGPQAPEGLEARKFRPQGRRHAAGTPLRSLDFHPGRLSTAEW